MTASRTSRVRAPPRLAGGAGLVAASALTGCSAGQHHPDGHQVPAVPGVNVDGVGPIALRNL